MGKTRTFTVKDNDLEKAVKKLNIEVERFIGHRNQNYYRKLINAEKASVIKNGGTYVVCQTINYAEKDQIHGPDTW